MRAQKRECFLCVYFENEYRQSGLVKKLAIKQLAGSFESVSTYAENDTAPSQEMFQELSSLAKDFDEVAFVTCGEDNWGDGGVLMAKMRNTDTKDGHKFNYQFDIVHGFIEVASVLLQNEDISLSDPGDIKNTYFAIFKEDLIVNGPFSYARAMSEILAFICKMLNDGDPERLPKLFSNETALKIERGVL